jgi:hypothetical protein
LGSSFAGVSIDRLVILVAVLSVHVMS